MNGKKKNELRCKLVNVVECDRAGLLVEHRNLSVTRQYQIETVGLLFARKYLNLIRVSASAGEFRNRLFEIVRSDMASGVQQKEPRFPLKEDCEVNHNCILNPHFPCKDRPCEPVQPRKLLTCDHHLRYPTPSRTDPLPHYAPNHPWYEPGKY